MLCSDVVYSFVLFNDPSTHEFYSYSHTLPLPDSLPCFRRDPLGAHHRQLGQRGRAGRREGGRRRGRGPHAADRRRPAAGAVLRLGSRSEEHTSELQSLMRKSYAVVCLKKKNKPTRQHTITTQQ